MDLLKRHIEKVKDGVLTDSIEYLSADMEEGMVIAQANIKIDNNNKIKEDLISCRLDGDYLMMRREEINYIDISPRQIVSVAASLIPF